MAKRSSFNTYEVSDTGNWNVAQPYVQLKIMRLLYFVDIYEEIATFGTSDILEELELSPDVIILNRIRGLKRMAKFLQMLIDNTLFAIKDKDKNKGKTELKKLYIDLKEAVKLMPVVEKTIYNQNTKTSMIEINEKLFNLLLDELVRIKEAINEPLNNADLIFSNTEEFDPDKYKEDFIEEITTTG